MKIALVFALLMSAAFQSMFAENSREEGAVLQTERDLCSAYLRGDIEAIRRNVMEDYTLTNSRGEITGRAQDVEEAKKGDPKYDVFENHDMKVRLHGDTAVVTGRTHVKGISSGKPFDAEFMFTDTLTKESDRWRLLAVHVSSVRRRSLNGY